MIGFKYALKRSLPQPIKNNLKSIIYKIKYANTVFRNALAYTKAGRIHFGSGLGDSGNLLYGIVRSMKPSVCVEIGSASGKSTCYIGLALKENNSGMLYAIDPHIPTYWSDDDSVDTFKELNANISTLNLEQYIKVCCAFSQD